MEIPEIPNFEQLVSEFLPKNKKYVKNSKRFLTAPGDNYASLILAVDITVLNEDSTEEIIPTAVKLLPPVVFMRQFMNIPYTVRNEIGFYQTILPTLRNFLKQRGSQKSLDFFPRFYGGKFSVDPATKAVSEDAILILENLKSRNFGLLDKNEGLDLDAMKRILAQLAELHGSVIALRELQPQEFKKKLMPFFDEFEIFQMGDNEGFMTSDVVTNAIIKIIEEDKFCSSYLDRVKKTISTCCTNLNLPKNAPKFHKDIFASLVHVDLWVNNIMFKTSDGKIEDIKLLDWQLYEYGGVAKDLLFFLVSSAQEKVLDENFDLMIQFYYESLIEVLKDLKCGVGKFGFDVFQKEFKECASEVSYLYFMMALPSIFASGSHVLEIHEVSKEALLAQVDVSDICRRRMCLITKKYIERGWI